MVIKAGCCIVNNGKVLLLKLRGDGSQNGKWGPPGGGVNPNEQADEAAKREVLEETSLKIKIKELLAIRLSPTYKEGYCFVFYSAQILNKAEIQIQEEEASEYAWATLKEIKENKFPLRKQFLKEILIESLQSSVKQSDLIKIIEI